MKKCNLVRPGFWLAVHVYIEGLCQRTGGGGECVLLQQALRWPSLQHIWDDDGRLSALEVGVVPAAWDGDSKPKSWSLQRQTQAVTSRKENKLERDNNSP